MDENCYLTDRQKEMLKALVPGLKDGDVQTEWQIIHADGGIFDIWGISQELQNTEWRNVTDSDFADFVNCGFIREKDGTFHVLHRGKIIKAVENNFGEGRSNSYFIPEIKETARKLVEAQKANEIDNEFELIDVTGGSGTTRREYARGLGIEESVDIPNVNHLSDLAYFGLLEIERSSKKIKVRLLASLRHTVENNFQSDLIENNDFGETGTKLDHTSLRQIKKFLISHVQTLNERKMIVNDAFYGTPLQSLIELEGIPRVFCSHLVTETLRYGVLQEDNDHAIFRLLTEIKDIVGTDKQTDIDEIAEKVRIQNR